MMIVTQASGKKFCKEEKNIFANNFFRYLQINN